MCKFFGAPGTLELVRKHPRESIFQIWDKSVTYKWSYKHLKVCEKNCAPGTLEILAHVSKQPREGICQIWAKSVNYEWSYKHLKNVQYFWYTLYLRNYCTC